MGSPRIGGGTGRGKRLDRKILKRAHRAFLTHLLVGAILFCGLPAALGQIPPLTPKSAAVAVGGPARPSLPDPVPGSDRQALAGISLSQKPAHPAAGDFLASLGEIPPAPPAATSPRPLGQGQGRTFEPVPALMDLRTTFSDGDFHPEALVQLALAKGFQVLCLNDHDRMVLEYGLPPFRNILKKRVERNSINKRGAAAYLRTVEDLRKRHPHVILLPGAESAPFYYWTGSTFAGDLTANDYERRILTVGLERPEDYETLPVLHNGLSQGPLRSALPALGAFALCFALAVLFVFWKGGWRIAGAVLALASAGLFFDTLCASPSPYDAYGGRQGAAPYQLFLDDVAQKGGLTFWNYPETRSGVRALGPIRVKTLPYPQMLLETRDYTGFAAVYGDAITATEPGNVWDAALQEYCAGYRKRPPWGIATADFHQEGGAGQRLGDFQTVLWLAEKTPSSVLAALKDGRMYACRGRFPRVPRLHAFSVSAADPGAPPQAISGEEIVLSRNPRIRISVSAGAAGIFGKGEVRVRLIRSGTPVQVFRGPLPLTIDYVDPLEAPGEKVYYRMDMAGAGDIVSNPIFVRFEQ